MTALTLSLAEHDLDTALARSVVARIYGFPARTGEAVAPAAAETTDTTPSVREVVIPATRERDAGLTVTVPPGRYRVQALLPTGRILQRSATVHEGETVPVVFDAGEATSAWLGWQSANEKAAVTPIPTAPETPSIRVTTRYSADDLTIEIADPRRLRSALQFGASVLRQTEPPRVIWKMWPRQQRYLAPANELKETVLYCSYELDTGGDLRSTMRAAFPRLLKAFERFDDVLPGLTRSWQRAPKDFARTVHQATFPIREALGLRVGPTWSTFSSTKVAAGADLFDMPEVAVAPEVRPPPTQLRVVRQSAAFGGEATWRAMQEGPDGDSVRQRLAFAAEADGMTKIETRGEAGLAGRWLLSREWDLDTERRWVMLSGAGGGALAVLPLPWFDPQNDRFVAADLAENSSADDGHAPLQLTLRDPTLGGLLAYLSHGNLSAARPMVDAIGQEELITRTIQAKVHNPFAACAAAYVGLAIFEPEERERWDGWLPNIVDQFPWLPDGPILHARRVLNRADTLAETQQVLPSLKEAYSRGIPYFSAGVHHLRDMLSLYAADAEVKPMLEVVSGVLSRVDRYQALTVIRFAPAATG